MDLYRLLMLNGLPWLSENNKHPVHALLVHKAASRCGTKSRCPCLELERRNTGLVEFTREMHKNQEEDTFSCYICA